MAKTLKETPTRSASAETKPLGAAMSLDDLNIDVRTQTVADSLERVLPSPPRLAEPRSADLTALEPATPPSRPKPSEKKKTQTQMLSTPIPADMKRRLNRLRLEHSVSTAFVLEVALTNFFAHRSDEDVAAELIARGGRLRRNGTQG